MKNVREMLKLYAVTDRSWLNGRTIYEQVEEAILGGATCVQLREKEMDEAFFLQEAVGMAKLCHRHGIPLLINDNIEIAMRSGADGVHIGQEDMEASAVRRMIGPDMIMGVTAKTVEQALKAQKTGADYLGSGAVFGTSTKMNARPMPIATLQSICGAVSIPVVAIGGINRNNIMKLEGTGIAGAAVVSGIFAAEDIEGECRYLRAQIEGILGK